MRESEKQRIKIIIRTMNRAEDKLYSAKKLIDESISLIETAFLLHNKNLYNELKKTKRKDRRDSKLKQVEEDLDDNDEMD